MTTTAVVEKPAATLEKKEDKKEEKNEKRRALGRGLDSLLPGPRAVAPPSGPRVPAPVSAAPVAVVGRPAEQGLGEIQAAADQVDSPPELRSAGQPGAAVPTQASGADDLAAGRSSQAAIPSTIAPGNGVAQILVADIEENPYQTRSHFEQASLSELADSIRANGVLQPIVVRPAQQDGKYILIMGERRLRAAKLAEKQTIPAIVRRVSEQQAAEMTIIENLQREDLNCIEQAEAFRVLSKEFNLTQEQIGQRVGLSRESVSNYMRLLKLPDKIREYLATSQISFSEARELMGLADPSLMEKAAETVVKQKLTLEKIVELVAKLNGWPDGSESKKVAGAARWIDPNVRAAQTDLERMLGVRVRIRDRHGKGKIVIEYSTVDDYERVVGMLRGNG